MHERILRGGAVAVLGVFGAMVGGASAVFVLIFGGAFGALSDDGDRTALLAFGALGGALLAAIGGVVAPFIRPLGLLLLLFGGTMHAGLLIGAGDWWFAAIPGGAIMALGFIIGIGGSRGPTRDWR